ncbi:uncharacterized protein LOC128132944 [Lactuca sativa]|uniref:uncharacterized protein LOC128132944 n=1 Tax=Lactuca sativa TaxID=4236 RepID=UPI0022B04532|nr:uncharacterized protein LOC128132944 [Lactuca sativa]
MVVVLTLKALEQFKSYSLVKIVGILKSHESVVTKETNVVSGMGSLALLSKGKNVDEEEEELDLSECDLTNDEYALMVSNPKKFARKKFPTTMKRNWQGSYNSKKGNIADDEFGGVEVWSTDSKDEEVCKPTDGRNFVAKKGNFELGGRYLMVTAGVSPMRGYITKGEGEEAKEREDKCFAAKPMGELINECDKSIKKRNIFCLISKRLYTNITQLHLDYEINKKIHKMILPFLELKEDEVDIDGYNCESIVSSDDISNAYKIAIVNEDNAGGCDDNFWSAPIDNADGTIGLSERTSWRVKGRSMAKPLNKPASFDVPSTSGTEEIPSEPAKVESETSSMKNESQDKRPKPKVNIHKSQKQLAEQKRQRNRRYQKNLNERKQFWQSQNSNYVRTEKASNLEAKARSKDNSGPCTYCQSCSQMNRKISFSPRSSGDKNQKPNFGPKPHPTHSQPKHNPNNIVNDVKGKRKLISKDKKETKKTSANPRKQENQNQNNNPQPDLRKPKDKKKSIVEHFVDKWYINSGCSCHMTGRREELREFQARTDGGCVKYSNNSYDIIKGYGMITNRDFSIRKVAYMEGLKHSLISISQLVVGSGLKVSFDDEGSEIIEKKSKTVWLKSQ